MKLKTDNKHDASDVQRLTLESFGENGKYTLCAWVNKKYMILDTIANPYIVYEDYDTFKDTYSGVWTFQSLGNAINFIIRCSLQDELVEEHDHEEIE